MFQICLLRVLVLSHLIVQKIDAVWTLLMQPDSTEETFLEFNVIHRIVYIPDKTKTLVLFKLAEPIQRLFTDIKCGG
jgi:hypothetical protein